MVIFGASAEVPYMDSVESVGRYTAAAWSGAPSVACCNCCLGRETFSLIDLKSVRRRGACVGRDAGCYVEHRACALCESAKHRFLRCAASGFGICLRL